MIAVECDVEMRAIRTYFKCATPTEAPELIICTTSHPLSLAALKQRNALQQLNRTLSKKLIEHYSEGSIMSNKQEVWINSFNVSVCREFWGKKAIK